MKRLILPVCALAAALAVGSASATPITTPGLTVSSGSLTFSNFTCAFNGSGTFAGACTTVDVAALAPPPAGIQFSTNLSVIGVSSADAALTFKVASTTGVDQVGLSFNSTFLGMTVNTVTEDVYSSLGGTLLGQAVVHCGFNTGCAATTTDTITLNGYYSNLYITKDVNLTAGDANSSGSTSIITQTFVATPEPMSLGLAGGALALFGLIGLRRRKA